MPFSLHYRKRIGAIACGLLALSGCGSDSDRDDDVAEGPDVSEPAPAPQPQPEQKILRVGVLPDTQGSSSGVAEHPMRAALDKLVQEGAEIVLMAGDLTENGTQAEYAQWRAIADEYTDRVTLLPIMGNHDNKGIDQDYFDTVGDLIPADATHMPGSKYKNYAVVRDNVLFINLSYDWLPFAYDFVEAQIDAHRERVDHIILMTHNSFVGNRYGMLREKILEGYLSEPSDVAFREVYDKYRTLFAANDVVYVSGHEHMYSRSQIRDITQRQFTQIVAGSAAYKGYENRYGEHEQVQNTVMVKMASESVGPIDTNVSVFTIQGPAVDYRAYYAPHTVLANSDGPRELASPDWRLFDRYTRTTTRCEKIVYPGSIPAGIQANNMYDPGYRTAPCASPSGQSARLLDGRNEVFNRYDTRTRAMAVEPGVTFAGTNRELESLMYRYMFIRHESWRPNLNNSQRARVIDEGTPDEEVEIRATTIDLSKHVTLSWKTREAGALSDTLAVSGISGQSGIYTDPYGAIKDITVDVGLAGSYGDGSEMGKQPVTLPAGATRDWRLQAGDTGHKYVLEFSLPADVAAQDAMLARWDGSTWVALTDAECVSAQAYRTEFLSGTIPSDVDGACAGGTLVGFDAARSAFWARLVEDGQFAVVARD
ncbi:metallophosphoesterase family protein [Bordetella genomosp. 13]|uniref:Serine/threonine protein phosphatase n=1 Tax=Bordetella genomosp. 13 TaxID=463040 RepID=A0A1W6ZJF0_9BORD|nr:metallophosphoesterase [Bordetella genomosp. 13]ARP97375.1 serine/threonine protein phosphatase [Bordetella genomosp. 13]